MTIVEQIKMADYVEVHAIDIDADLTTVWKSFTNLDFFGSKLILLLFTLRGIRLAPTSSQKIAGWHSSWSLLNNMFDTIELEPKKLLTQVIRPKKFGLHPEINIGWDFRFISIAVNRTRVITQTRVHIPSHFIRFRKLFRLYWYLIRLPSGAIRLEILRMIKNKSER